MIGEFHENWSTCERLLSHALASSSAATDLDLNPEAVAQVLTGAGEYLAVRARYSEAEHLLRQAVAISERVLGRSILRPPCPQPTWLRY